MIVALYLCARLNFNYVDLKGVDFIQHFIFLRKTSGLFFGKNQVFVHFYFKYASIGTNEICFHSEFFFQFCSQTGCTG